MAKKSKSIISELAQVEAGAKGPDHAWGEVGAERPRTQAGRGRAKFEALGLGETLC